jgi:hypothetical protein
MKPGYHFSLLHVADFIGTPMDTTVYITSDMETVLFGDFRCATRRPYLPLWVVNGVSIDLILDTPGYNGTYTEYIPLQVEGNILSFISIPALPATNNSIVSCAVIQNSSHSIDVIAYAMPVHMTVLQGKCTES